MSTSCYSILCHGGLPIKSKYCDIPPEIELVLYTSFENFLFLDEFNYLKEIIKCKNEEGSDIKKGIKIYKLIDNGTILCSDIQEKKFSGRIPDLEITFNDEIMELGIFEKMFGRKLLTNFYDTEKKIELLGIKSLSELIIFFQENIKNIDRPIGKSKIKDEKHMPEKYRIHLFCCLEGNYKMGKLSEELDVDIDTFLTEKFNIMNINNNCKNATKYHMENRDKPSYKLLYITHDLMELTQKLKEVTSFHDFPFETETLTEEHKKLIEYIQKNLITKCFKGFNLNDVIDKGYNIIVGKITFTDVNDIVNCMCLIQKNADHYYIHAVCVDEKHRGFGLMRKMFEYIANNIPNKKTKIYLNASALKNFGMNLKGRLDIYTKLGFYLELGTKIQIKDRLYTIVSIVGANYEMEDNNNKKIYIRKIKDINQKIVACIYPQGENIEGCKMISTPELILDNKIKPIIIKKATLKKRKVESNMSSSRRNSRSIVRRRMDSHQSSKNKEYTPMDISNRSRSSQRRQSSKRKESNTPMDISSYHTNFSEKSNSAMSM